MKKEIEEHSLLKSAILHLLPGLLGIVAHCLLNSVDFFIGLMFKYRAF